LAFRFEHPDLPIDDNVRRAAKAEFDRAIAEVTETGFEVHETIRNVRRRLKRIRSILRLIRPVFADFASENTHLRDIGAEVSGLRDAAALIETVDRLLPGADADAAAPLARLRATLATRAAEEEARLDRETFLTELRSMLRDARVRSELWELSGRGRRSIVPGFVATYSRARRAFHLAARRPSNDNLHAWRKRVKYHWSQLGLVRDFAPAFLEVRRARVGKLAEWLGEHHNLCVLLQSLDGGPVVPQGETVRIAMLAEAELDRLASKSLKLGRLLFADKAKRVKHRWRGYFDDWRSAAKLQATR
jgi:hypothetical protein